MQTSVDVMGEVFFALCKTVDTPVSLGAWLRFKYAPKELAEMSIDPDDYSSSHSFAVDYGCSELLSKWKGLETGIDTEAEAYRRFTTAESQCREANIRIRTKETSVKGRVGAVLYSAQRKISQLLGEMSLFKIENYFGWGPGASFEIPRRRAYVDTKISELPITVTRKALPLARSVIESDLHWSASILGQYPEGPFCLCKEVWQIVEGNRLDTVPKSAKTDRMIAVEPRMNAYLQKGVGGYIRSRLRRYGINLDDQTRNQELARRAAREGLATVDLSMASDTVSIECVYALIPYEWWSLLDDLRSVYGQKPDGTWLRYEKFSSMGNGFTFELETLIFWAIAESIRDLYHPGTVVSVYGDDIIVSKDAVELLSEVLSFLGFSMNVEKTHIDGRFFESCGKHYFDDVEVTPAYQKEVLDEPVEAIRFGNRLIRLAERWGLGIYLDSALRPAWWTLRRHFEATTRYQIPYGSEADDGWAVPNEYFFSARKGLRANPNRGLESRVLKPLTLKSSRRHQRDRRNPNSRVPCGLPANDGALLAAYFVRHRVSPDPMMAYYTVDCDGFRQALPLPDHGELDAPVLRKKKQVHITSTRWVIPTGKFQLEWM